MKICENCGAELAAGQICGCRKTASATPVSFNANVADGGGVFASMKNRMGVGTPEQNATDVYERGMNIVPENVAAQNGETHVKQYNVAVLRNLLKFERSEGRLQITDKRVIFRAAGRSIGGRVSLQNEFAINEIGGIEAKRNYKFNFLYLIFAFFIAFFSYYMLGDGGSSLTRDMMTPGHVRAAHENEARAINQYHEAERNIPHAIAADSIAKVNERKAETDAREGVMRTRQVRTGTDWYGNPIHENRRFRDTTAATMAALQDTLRLVTARRVAAENALRQAIETRDKNNDAMIAAIKKRENTVATWHVIMTIVGLVLGFGGIVPFFVLYKNFGLKLLILNASVFGFVLGLTASEHPIFHLFIAISVAIIIACIYLYCFRENLVISVRNKMGRGGTIDVRRETTLTFYTEKGLGFYEVIPTEETESAIREIGAIIGNIQKGAK